jgi:hypothetical protein
MGVFMSMEEVALEEVHSELLWFSSANHHSTIAHTHLSSSPEMCDSPDKAPCHNIIGLCVGGFTSTGIDWLEYGSSIVLEQIYTDMMPKSGNSSLLGNGSVNGFP